MSVIKSATSALDLMQVFFVVVAVIAMTLCFFILWLSFTANVKENSWEFGVLRSLGLSGVNAVLIYVYEALCLVISCLLLGTSIGILVACTLTLQFNLFVELPFRFIFPTSVFGALLGMSFGCAIFGSGLPAYRFLRKQISRVLRGQA